MPSSRPDAVTPNPGHHAPHHRRRRRPVVPKITPMHRVIVVLALLIAGVAGAGAYAVLHDPAHADGDGNGGK